MTDSEARAARIRLVGERFTGGRLPVDSLIELERYQRLVRIIAKSDWLREHPDEDLPAGFEDDIRLTITRIEDGSADVLLAFEQYNQVQVQAAEEAEAAVSAVYQGLEIPDFPDEIRSQVETEILEWGSTLEADQALVFYPAEPTQDPVVVNVETRQHAIERHHATNFLLTPAPIEITRAGDPVETSMLGRVVEVDANAMSLMFETLDARTLKVRFKNSPHLLADAKKLLNTSSHGALTRLDGELQSKGGEPWRFKNAWSIQQFDVGDEAWGQRLLALGGLAPGWDGSSARAISFTALDAAFAVLRELPSGFELPGVFPTSEGGVLIEWSSSARVTSVEISAAGHFELFHLPEGSFEAIAQDTANAKEAALFAVEKAR